MFRRLADWGDYVIGDTYSAANEGLKGAGRRRHRRGARHVDRSTRCSTSCIADDLRTVLWPIPPDDDAAVVGSCAREVWERPARDDRRLRRRRPPRPHVRRALHDALPRRLLRGRQLVSIERAVQMITDTPARLFGLRDRGRVVEGAHADLVVFDPETVDSEPA